MLTQKKNPKKSAEVFIQLSYTAILFYEEKQEKMALEQ